MKTGAPRENSAVVFPPLLSLDFLSVHSPAHHLKFLSTDFNEPLSYCQKCWTILRAIINSPFLMDSLWFTTWDSPTCALVTAHSQEFWRNAITYSFFLDKWHSRIHFMSMKTRWELFPWCSFTMSNERASLVPKWWGMMSLLLLPEGSRSHQAPNAEGSDA